MRQLGRKNANQTRLGVWGRAQAAPGGTRELAKPAKDKSLGRTVAGKYRIESVLRATELGRLYNATHLLTEKRVTLKILSPALAVDDKIVSRFMEEAKTLSSFSHPNILNVTDFGSEPDGDTYIVYEAVEGITLKDEIVVEGAFPLGRVLDVSRQIASGLIAAHARGMMHGSLGGDKVMLYRDSEGREAVKIMGLGTAASGETVALASQSSFEYLSPEQCADPSNFDARADIYSLGAMLYEMLTGELPFNGSNPGELMMKQATQPPPPLSAFRSDLPPGLEPIVLSALAKNRELRYQTMGDLLSDVNALEVSHESPSGAAQTSAAEENVWKTAFVVLAGVSVLSIGLIYFTYVPRTDPSTVAAADSGAMPVQPINPATGINEQGLASIIPMTAEAMQQINPMTMPSPMADPLGGSGDGYNPWSGGPPPGAPAPIQPGGQVITVQEGNSPFMPPDNSGIYLVPQQVPTPAPQPGAPKAQDAGGSQPSAQPTPEAKPAASPKPPAEKEKTP